MSDTSGTGAEGAIGNSFGWQSDQWGAQQAEVAIGKKAAFIGSTLQALVGPLQTAINKLNKGAGGGVTADGGSFGSPNAVQMLDPSLSGAGGARPKHMASLATRMQMGGQIANTASGGQGGGMFGQAARVANAGGSFGGSLAAQIATQVAGAINQALNARVERGYQYSLSADKMNVMYQQMTGMSQQQVQSTFRQPLTNYRLGGGESINALLGMQARTGISALGQARSVEAIRTMSGYSYSAEDATRMITSLGSAPVANRMFMTMGTSLYGIGGKQNDTMSVIQAAVRGSGLTDPRIAASALQQGSATRARLSFMGVPEDMQDMVIQYAQENAAFAKKGGKGMYDPSKKDHRRTMGVEENFATQKEETERLKTRREENFYNRQADNFADLERMTQTLTKRFGELEDKLSGLIGAKISAGGAGKAAGGIAKGLGSGLLTAGLMANAIPGAGTFAGAGMIIAGGLLTAGGAIFGDPTDPDGKPSGGTSNASSEVVQKMQQASSFKKMHPTMQQRITKMVIASGGRVGFGGGYRSTESQTQMFTSRYSVVTDQEAIKRKDYDYHWNGKYWKHTSGAPAAPPGRSMHEIGLAADMTGDMDWIVANASKFGLKHFKSVNNEPWHVQPSELPDSRTKYEKLGAPWGGGGPAYDAGTEGAQYGLADAPSGGHDGGSGVQLYGSMSVGEIIDAVGQRNRATLGNTSGAGGLSYGVGSSTPTKQLSGGVLSGKEIVSVMKGAGFSGEDLVKAVAISHRESRWNPRAHNPSEKTKDNSYGLFQLNMRGEMGKKRAKDWGLKDYTDLFDPELNARLAKGMSWYHWGPYKGLPETYNTDMSAAAATVRAAENTGDPTSFLKNSGPQGGNTYVGGGTTITIAPQITLHGGEMSMDLKRIAREVGRLIKQEVDLEMLRGR